jgi:Transposase DNA-binding
MEAIGDSDWAMEWFGGVDLRDERRNRRLRHSVERILAHPGGTLPQKLRESADLDGFYRLMNSEEVTAERILAPVVARTQEKMLGHPGVVLIIHDATTLDFSGLHSIEDLGPIGDGHGRGLLAHNSLAITTEREVLGLAGQILHCRRVVPRRETKAQRRAAQGRESRLWKKGCEALPAAPPGQLWVDVTDRGGDITEFLSFEHKASRHYVVRSQHNRRVEATSAPGAEIGTRLHDFVRSQTPQEETPRRTLVIPARAGRSKRSAELAVAWCELTILPPRQPRGDHDRTPLRVWAVRVWEPTPPAGIEGIEWILLTNVPVLTAGQASDRVDWYSCRWVIEEYHKGLKTGCGVEDLQFTRRASLEPAIAVLSVVAIKLLQIRDASRSEIKRSQPATDYVPELWVRVLSAWRHNKPRMDWTVGDFLFALARLGGHQNRRHDHPPGWLILWRGWTNLETMLDGAMAYARCGET